MMDCQYKKAYTHGGLFHADDVFSWAILHRLFPDMELTRGYAPPVDDSETIVFDIGNSIFDHHQTPRELRRSGVPYAAFGKVVRYFRKKLFSSEYDYRNFDKTFIQPLDREDNDGPGQGGASNSLYLSIMAFNPQYGEDQSDAAQDAAFYRAAEVAGQILDRQLTRLSSMSKAGKTVTASLSKMKNHIIVFDEYVPFGTKYINTECYYVVAPSQRGGFNAICVNSPTGSPKVPFPAEWRGLPEPLLLETFPGLKFCHASGFMAGFNSKEQAIAGCEFVIANAAVEKTDILA